MSFCCRLCLCLCLCLSLFGSNRSSRNANVCLSICAAQSTLEQSIFIFLGQRAFRKKSKGNLAVRKQSKSSQSITIRVSQSVISHSLKYCVLLALNFVFFLGGFLIFILEGFVVNFGGFNWEKLGINCVVEIEVEVVLLGISSAVWGTGSGLSSLVSSGSFILGLFYESLSDIRSNLSANQTDNCDWLSVKYS